LPLDARQVEEFLLTAAQTLFGVAVLLTLRFPRWLAVTLLGLFALQYAVPWQAGRYVLIAVYLVAGLAALARNRRGILPTLAAPLRRSRDRGTPAPTRSAAADAGEPLAGSGTRAPN
jgi:cation:H+ antiporter